MLFVTGLPFLYYCGLYFKEKDITVRPLAGYSPGLACSISDGSRGGLVGLAVTLLVIAFRSTRKIVGIGLILLFVVAYQQQAGDIMKGRAGQIC